MTEPEIVEQHGVPTAVVRATVPVAQLPNVFDRSFPTLFRALQEQGVRPASAAFALYHGQPGDTVDLEVGFVTGREVHPDGDVASSSLPAGSVARLVHVGGYDSLGDSWERLKSWIEGQGLAPGPVLWEVYLTEPSPETDPADLRTELNWPVATGAGTA